MRILLLKTDQPQAELYLYDSEKQLAKTVWQADRRLAETLNTTIEELMVRAGLDQSKIEAIGIFSGPGSFTGLRIGHSVANALAYGLNVPIVGSQGANWTSDALKGLLDGANSRVAVPVYGAPVHITQPRK